MLSHLRLKRWVLGLLAGHVHTGKSVTGAEKKLCSRILFDWWMIAQRRKYLALAARDLVGLGLYTNGGEDTREAEKDFDEVCTAMGEASKRLLDGSASEILTREALFIDIVEGYQLDAENHILRRVLEVYLDQLHSDLERRKTEAEERLQLLERRKTEAEVRSLLLERDHFFFQSRDLTDSLGKLVALYAQMVRDDSRNESSWYLRVLVYTLLELFHGREMVVHSLLAVLRGHARKACGFRKAYMDFVFLFLDTKMVAADAFRRREGMRVTDKGTMRVVKEGKDVSDSASGWDHEGQMLERIVVIVSKCLDVPMDVASD